MVTTKRVVPSNAWLVVVYKMPAEPAAKRVALWRRLKSIGAVYLQNGVCLLPRSDVHVRQVRMLANDIQEAGGDSVILETAGLDKVQDKKVVSRFNSDRNEQYQEFLDRCDDFQAEMRKEIALDKYTYAELEEEDIDLRKLRLWLERINKLDFFQAALATDASAKLYECERMHDDYAQKVFAAHVENQ